jgi:hypothetical protein
VWALVHRPGGLPGGWWGAGTRAEI